MCLRTHEETYLADCDLGRKAIEGAVKQASHSVTCYCVGSRAQVMLGAGSKRSVSLSNSTWFH